MAVSPLDLVKKVISSALSASKVSTPKTTSSSNKTTNSINSSNKSSSTNSSSNNNSGQSYAYDPGGNKVNVTIKNGQSYLDNGQRVGAGYTVQTGGGIYKMGDDGKGVKVDSHNISNNNYVNNLVNALPSVNKSNTSNKDKSGDSLSFGNYDSKSKVSDLGYDPYYEAQYKHMEDMYNKYKDTDPMTADAWLKALNRQKEVDSAPNLMKEFANWDRGDLDTYIRNKLKAENPNLYNISGQSVKDLGVVNQGLRDKYGVTEDKYSYNDLGEIGLNMILGDGLLGSNLPVGNKSGARLDAENEVLRSVIEGGPTSQEQSNSLNKGLVDSLMNASTSNVNTGIPGNASFSNADIVNYVPLDNSNSDIGGIYQTNQGYFMNYEGQTIPISELDYIELMETILGF